MLLYCTPLFKIHVLKVQKDTLVGKQRQIPIILQTPTFFLLTISGYAGLSLHSPCYRQIRVRLAEQTGC